MQDTKGTKGSDKDLLENDFLKALSREDFLNLGVDHIVYIKPSAAVDHKTTYTLHAADGTLLSSHENKEIAALAAVSNDLAPVTLH